MADFVYINEGKDFVNVQGWPATVFFLLSTSAVGVITASSTLAGGVGEITGTGYTRKSQARPASSNGTLTFTTNTWQTLSATNWPNNVASIIAATTVDNTGKALCCWNLQVGGAVRDLSGANTTENSAPVFTA